jgi:hypothetical protein
LSALVPLRSIPLGDRFDFSFESVAMLTGPIEFGTGFAEVDGRSFFQGIDDNTVESLFSEKNEPPFEGNILDENRSATELLPCGREFKINSVFEFFCSLSLAYKRLCDERERLLLENPLGWGSGRVLRRKDDKPSPNAPSDMRKGSEVGRARSVR